MNYHDTFNTLFSDITKSSEIILGKIHRRTNKNDLADNIQDICCEVIRNVGHIHFALKNRTRHSAPIEIVNYISSFAHICHIGLVMLDSRRKEELLKYFYEWTDVAPGVFEELIAGMLDVIYHHDDLCGIMAQCEHFLRTFATLWDRMSKLEYIGQHRESIIVSERSQEKDDTGKITPLWSVGD